jgi:hypothetical protein
MRQARNAVAFVLEDFTPESLATTRPTYPRPWQLSESLGHA